MSSTGPPTGTGGPGHRIVASSARRDIELSIDVRRVGFGDVDEMNSRSSIGQRTVANAPEGFGDGVAETLATRRQPTIGKSRSGTVSTGFLHKIAPPNHVNTGRELTPFHRVIGEQTSGVPDSRHVGMAYAVGWSGSPTTKSR